MRLFKSIFAIIVVSVISGCATYQVISEPTYTQKKITYRVTDNKPVTGIVEQFQGGVIEYRTYNQGKLLDLKTVSTRDNRAVCQ
ncbi:hypothetical protein [Vibrio sp. SCSIO 43137]|uniref:hypothetical protein n=1 Tax=Vibrio sp. SCSIO 43137 TaxID=3021011 RepID=UPI002307A1D8|nr:hypothetical protein [Vibrio sp. SCSIO 43137]WCE32476.1 hypothetical protein PK654_18465 [Vibrio sp. SCSIO 43137]